VVDCIIGPSGIHARIPAPHGRHDRVEPASSARDDVCRHPTWPGPDRLTAGNGDSPGTAGPGHHRIAG